MSRRMLVPLDGNIDQITSMTQQLRLAMFDAVREKDVKDIMARTVEQAKNGDQASVKIIMDYMLGGKASVQNVNVQKVSMHAMVKQHEEDIEVDRTVRQIEQMEPQAERVYRLLAMVMDHPPSHEELVVLGENQLEQAERWATEQAKANRQALKAKHKDKVVWPVRPSFLKGE